MKFPILSDLYPDISTYRGEYRGKDINGLLKSIQTQENLTEFKDMALALQFLYAEGISRLPKQNKNELGSRYKAFTRLNKIVGGLLYDYNSGKLSREGVLGELEEIRPQLLDLSRVWKKTKSDEISLEEVNSKIHSVFLPYIHSFEEYSKIPKNFKRKLRIQLKKVVKKFPPFLTGSFADNNHIEILPLRGTEDRHHINNLYLDDEGKPNLPFDHKIETCDWVPGIGNVKGRPVLPDLSYFAANRVKDLLTSKGTLPDVIVSDRSSGLELATYLSNLFGVDVLPLSKRNRLYVSSKLGEWYRDPWHTVYTPETIVTPVPFKEQFEKIKGKNVLIARDIASAHYIGDTVEFIEKFKPTMTAYCSVDFNDGCLGVVRKSHYYKSNVLIDDEQSKNFVFADMKTKIYPFGHYIRTAYSLD